MTGFQLNVGKIHSYNLSFANLYVNKVSNVCVFQTVIKSIAKF